MYVSSLGPASQVIRLSRDVGELIPDTATVIWDSFPHPTVAQLPWQVGGAKGDLCLHILRQCFTAPSLYRSDAVTGYRSVDASTSEATYSRHLPLTSYHDPTEDITNNLGFMTRIRAITQPDSWKEFFIRARGENNVLHPVLRGTAVKIPEIPVLRSEFTHTSSGSTYWAWSSPSKYNVDNRSVLMWFDQESGFMLDESSRIGISPRLWELSSVAVSLLPHRHHTATSWCLLESGAGNNWTNVYQNRYSIIDSIYGYDITGNALEDTGGFVVNGRFVCQSWATGARPTGPSPNNWATFWIQYQIVVQHGHPHTKLREVPYVGPHSLRSGWSSVGMTVQLTDITYGSTVPAADKTALNLYKGTYLLNSQVQIPWLDASAFSSRVAPTTWIKDVDSAKLSGGLWNETITTGVLKQCEVYDQDLRGLAIASAGEAQNNLFGSLSNNWLESIWELSDPLSLLPNGLEGISKLLKHGRAMNLLMIGAKLLDVITSLKLYHSFALGTNQRAVAEFCDEFDRIWDRIRSTQGRVTVYGGATFHGLNIDGDHIVFNGSVPSMIVLRSKLVFKTEISSFLLTLLGARALGLLPTASALWDIVPMSFVVDWFLGISSKLKKVDDSLTGILLPLDYGVHSYTVYHDLSEAYWDAIDTSSPYIVDGTRPVQYYRRWVSRFFPTIRVDSRFHLDTPTLPSDTGLVGSVAWKLFR